MMVPSAYRITIRKSRKQHQCFECSQAINVGDMYTYSSGVWDGEPRSYKQCIECSEVFQALTNDGYEVCYGDLFDVLCNLDCKYQAARDDLTDSINADIGAAWVKLGGEL